MYHNSLHIKKQFCVGSSKHFPNCIYLSWGQGTEFVYSPQFADGEAEAQQWRLLSAVVRHWSKQSRFPGTALTHRIDSGFFLFCSVLGVSAVLAASFLVFTFAEVNAGPCIREQHTAWLPGTESKHKNAVLPGLSPVHTWCAALLKSI